MVCRSYNDHVTDDGRRGTSSDRTDHINTVTSPVVLHEVYGHLLTEALNLVASIRIERDQMISGGDDQDPTISIWVFPVCDSAPRIWSGGCLEAFPFIHSPGP